MSRSEELFQKAKTLIPGGVNSPVRAYGAIGEAPRFIEKADGCHIYDVDGREYIDYISSWGPMILGHNHPEVRKSIQAAAENGVSFGCATEVEVEMAEYLCENIPHVDMIRMVNSGTEAVMSALRVARGYTGRNKIIKFAGNYHGHTDSMLVSAGSGVMTSGVPDSAGVTKGCAEDTLSAIYNNLENVSDLFKANPDSVAAVIVEPVAANMGVVLPKEGFLEGLRSLCDQYGALLIFDEVITGFRLGFEGAAGYFGIVPDLVTYGKIIGAGMPVGAYGGKREIMEIVAPVGRVYQAGTLSGNPLAMHAGLTQLKILKETPDFYQSLNEKADWFYKELEKILEETNSGCVLNHIGTIGTVFCMEENPYDYESSKKSDTGKFAEYFKYLLNHGVHGAPSQFEAMFVSEAHTIEDLNKTLLVIREFFESLDK